MSTSDFIGMVINLSDNPRELGNEAAHQLEHEGNDGEEQARKHLANRLRTLLYQSYRY